jgi:hypothetical protein
MNPNTTEHTMYAVTGIWNEEETFKLIPFSKDAVFIEVIFDPTQQILVLISKDKKSQYHLVEKLDDDGNPILRKSAVKNLHQINTIPYKKERRLIDTFVENYVYPIHEIEELVSKLIWNQDFDFKKYFKPQMPANSFGMQMDPNILQEAISASDSAIV